MNNNHLSLRICSFISSRCLYADMNQSLFRKERHNRNRHFQLLRHTHSKLMRALFTTMAIKFWNIYKQKQWIQHLFRSFRAWLLFWMFQYQGQLSGNILVCTVEKSAAVDSGISSSFFWQKMCPVLYHMEFSLPHFIAQMESLVKFWQHSSVPEAEVTILLE